MHLPILYPVSYTHLASSTKIDQTYFDAAIKLGRLLANRHIRLINGAGNIGLMRSVADAVLQNGGEVTGVIPHFMVDQPSQASPFEVFVS